VKYPERAVKIYPDAKTGFKLTYEHQSNNGFIEKNGLWRKGSPCLDSQLRSLRRYDFDSEPFDPDNRLFWHVKRLIDWINAVNNNELVSAGEPFELPQFNENINESFVFSEDDFSFQNWNKNVNSFGIADLGKYKSNKNNYFIIKEFKTLRGKIVYNINWGKYLSLTLKDSVPALWIILNEVPILNKWQAPNTFEELINVFEEQNMDFYDIIQKIIYFNSIALRNGKQHLLILGFPIPKNIYEEDALIHWQAIKLPVLYTDENLKYISKYVRNPEHYLSKKDKYHVLKPELELQWLSSENWSLQKITNRGRLPSSILSKKTLIIGAGTIGASVAELLARDGITNMAIMDYDILEIGNLSRHPLSLKDVGEFKSTQTAIHLTFFNPNITVEPITKIFEFSEDIQNDMADFDLIIDCTGEDDVLYELEKFEFEKEKTFVSISIGFGAGMLYLSLQNGKKFNADKFIDKISSWIEKDVENFPEDTLPRDRTNCWSPTFPARYDDILIASSTAIKVIEDFITQKRKDLNVVYKKYSENGSLIGYINIG